MDIDESDKRGKRGKLYADGKKVEKGLRGREGRERNK